MSTTDQPAPGWWLASDGAWYPPELAPEPPLPESPKDKKSNRLLWALVGAAGLIVILCIIGVVAGPQEENAAKDVADRLVSPARSNTPVAPTTVEAPPSTTAVPTTAVPTTAVPTTAPPPTTAPTTVPPTTAPQKSTSQTNAERSAAAYIDMTGFSRSGLIDQLKFEGYTEAEATQAVDSIRVDWNEQAARSAAAYQKMMPFSRQGLIDQLKFEGYTEDQAQHGASAVGL